MRCKMSNFTLLGSPLLILERGEGKSEHKWIQKFILNELAWEEFLGSKTKIKVNPSHESATELATAMHF
ncbi:MAG: hypothetical protein OEV87_00465 [Phycisphaerae bacterium]|nr:hypothetical protein [Phycisphaerae bacterium]